MARVGDRDIPARQCTNTQPLASRTLSVIDHTTDENSEYSFICITKMA